MIIWQDCWSHQLSIFLGNDLRYYCKTWYHATLGRPSIIAETKVSWNLWSRIHILMLSALLVEKGHFIESFQVLTLILSQLHKSYRFYTNILIFYWLALLVMLVFRSSWKSYFQVGCTYTKLHSRYCLKIWYQILQVSNSREELNMYHSH